MDHQSIWSKTTAFPAREPLRQDCQTEVAIIGGGMAGILTAHLLKQAGVSSVVLEAAQVASGQTRNTTAKITLQHDLIYHRLVQQRGEEQARQYANANRLAVDEYRRIIAGGQIDCDLTDAPAYLYSTAERESLAREFEAARKLGIDADYGTKTELPFPVMSALRFSHQARFHPLKFLHAIAQPLEIYGQTRVQAAEGNRLTTNHGVVTARKIVFACHYPFLNMPGFYFMRMHQERSYVIALENAAQYEGMYLGVDQDGLSIRMQGNLLLLGGGSHRTGENSAGGQYQKLREAATQYWPQSKEVAAWSAQDCMPLDGVPYIGQFSEATPDWYVATGFQKWGMTSSMVAAMLIRDAITGQTNENAPVFSPLRFTPSASAMTLMQETAQAVKGLSRKLFTPSRAHIEELPNNHGGVVEYDGEKVGVYKDENGETFLVSVRCPHLGCQLEWNPDEKSWDCPCHGSRFDVRGNLMDNPAQEGIEHA